MISVAGGLFHGNFVGQLFNRRGRRQATIAEPGVGFGRLVVFQIPIPEISGLHCMATRDHAIFYESEPGLRTRASGRRIARRPHDGHPAFPHGGPARRARRGPRGARPSHWRASAARVAHAGRPGVHPVHRHHARHTERTAHSVAARLFEGRAARKHHAAQPAWFAPAQHPRRTGEDVDARRRAKLPRAEP